MSDDHDEDFVGCETWDQMTVWLADSLPEIPPGVTIDFGPKDMRIDDEPLDAETFDDPLEALCAQIVVLRHGRYLVRRSHVVMEATSYVDHDASAATPDLWFGEDPTSDCTDGAIYVDDARLAAEICVTWLVSESGEASPDAFGFDVSEALPLPGLPDAGSPWTIEDFLRRLGH
ncbi:hypothetical protein MYK68_13470 [Gordonia sp. PP30]|uniref:hypothetical protein n=1 Tax=Gordonia sp. PP30 TaxID=2935861 RepID=UPI001FFFAA75|nr:hypothetical protein [Gordonia sp. PP30]UQE73745.1 hypothetical protein MYK68_13470 [Gordonia sp. PP30]